MQKNGDADRQLVLANRRRLDADQLGESCVRGAPEKERRRVDARRLNVASAARSPCQMSIFWGRGECPMSGVFFGNSDAAPLVLCTGSPYSTQSWRMDEELRRASMNRNHEATVAYPSHVFDPLDYAHFIDEVEFERDWSALGLGADDLVVLSIAIMADTQCGDAVEGSLHLRRLEFHPADFGLNQGEPVRLFYVHLPNCGIVLFVLAQWVADDCEFSDNDLEVIDRAVSQIGLAFSKKAYH